MIDICYYVDNRLRFSTMSIKLRDLKKIKCPECEGKLRPGNFGIICERNHFFDKQSSLWLGIIEFLNPPPTFYCWCGTEEEKLKCTCAHTTERYITKMMHEFSGRVYVHKK